MPSMGGRQSQAAISLLGLGQVAAAAAVAVYRLVLIFVLWPSPPQQQLSLVYWHFVSSSSVSIHPQRRWEGDQNGFITLGSGCSTRRVTPQGKAEPIFIEEGSVGTAAWRGFAALPGTQRTVRGGALITLRSPQVCLWCRTSGRHFSVVTIRQTVSKLAPLCLQAVLMQHRDETFSEFLHRAWPCKIIKSKGPVPHNWHYRDIGAPGQPCPMG